MHVCERETVDCLMANRIVLEVHRIKLNKKSIRQLHFNKHIQFQATYGTVWLPCLCSDSGLIKEAPNQNEEKAKACTYIKIDAAGPWLASKAHKTQGCR